MNSFEETIQALGVLLGAPLHAIKGSICKLQIEGSLDIQIEHEPEYRRILIACYPCELPPGRFRENALKEGLKANDCIDSFGTLAYSEKNNSLAYFLYISDTSSAEQLSEALQRFIEEAKNWKQAVERGELHLISQKSSTHFPLR